MHDAEQLLAVGIDLQLIRYLDAELNAGIVGSIASISATSLTSGLQLDETPMRRRLGRAAVGEHLGRIAHGAVDGAQQRRREALDDRIVDIGQPVGDQLRGRQDVAHVVVDLRHCEAEIGEVLLLLQGLLQLLLHRRQMLAGDRKLVMLPAPVPARGRDQTGSAAEILHVGRHPPDRRDHQAADCQENQHGGEQAKSTSDRKNTLRE